MQKMIKALAVVAMALAAGAAQAQSPATTTFQVSANVQAACAVSATDLAFGDYSPLAASPLDTTSTITVTCTNGTTYGVDLGPTPDVRTIAGPQGSLLNFGMFMSDHTTPFAVPTGTVAGLPHTVYGRIPAAQFARPGGYSGTVTVTVSY
jgi:spore coat protein U-like protein